MRCEEQQVDGIYRFFEEGREVIRWKGWCVERIRGVNRRIRCYYIDYE